MCSNFGSKQLSKNYKPSIYDTIYELKILQMYILSFRFKVYIGAYYYKSKVNEYDQEMQQSYIADQPTAPQKD